MSISDFAADTPAKEKTEWQSPSDKTEEPKPAPSTTEAPTAPVTATSITASKPDSEQPKQQPTTPPSAATSATAITSSILDRIAPAGDTKHSFLKVFLFGDPGSTKSSFLGTAPNNLIADFEDGLISLKHNPHGMAENVQSVRTKTFEEYLEIVRALHNNDPNLESFETFSTDTLSELQKKGLAEITEREWRKRPSTNRYVPETEHHQENNERIVRLVRALRDLDRHIIITAHSKTVEPKGKPAKTYADFSESLSNKVMAQMDVAAHVSMQKIDGKPTPVFRVISDGVISSKNRLNLPEEIADLTFPQLIKAWNKSNDS